MSEFDDIPIRLPSGTKAIVRLPRPFTTEDAQHLSKFLALYIEDDWPKGHRDMIEGQSATHPKEKQP
jgi:hypothetical protein